MRALALLGFAFLTLLDGTGCSTNSNPVAPDGGNGKLGVSAVTPTTGAFTGSQYINITGENFVVGSNTTVKFGDLPATNVQVISPLRISCRLPKSESLGAVDVLVTGPDGQTATLAGGFTFTEPSVTPKSLDDCKLLPWSVYASPGTATPIFGQVWGADVTNLAGQGVNVEGQVGVGTGDDPSTWAWSPATYDSDQDNGAADEYTAKITAPGTFGTYNYAARFRYAGGDWIYCDTDGFKDHGFTASLDGVETVGAPRAPQIDLCRLQYPVTDQTGVAGTATASFYGRVAVAGLTERKTGQAPAGITAEFGYGTVGSAPNTWSHWSPATYNVSCETAFCANTNEDEYQFTPLAPSAGTYLTTFRFSIAGGALTYCDLNGKTDGSSTDNLVKLTTTGSSSGKVDGCKLSSGTFNGSAGGAISPAPTASVSATGFTGNPGGSSNVTGQVGYGPSGSDASSSGWTWTDAAFQANSGAAGDTYGVASWTAPGSAGNFDVAARFALGGGSFTYCDTDATTTAYTASANGKLTVSASTSGSCSLLTLSPATVVTGGVVTTVGSIVIPGKTGGTTAATGVKVQVGSGPQGDASSGSTWGWRDATYLGKGTASDDKYQATIQPAFTGARSVDYRFSTNGGTSWTYCNASNGRITVSPMTKALGGFDSCFIQWPPQLPQDGSTDRTVYMRVHMDGVTDVSGNVNHSGDLTAEVGYGSASLDPGVSSAWTWLPGTFNVQVNNTFYEYLKAVPAGTFNYAVRFKKASGGTVYCYGDKDASDNGFTWDQTGFATQ